MNQAAQKVDKSNVKMKEQLEILLTKEWPVLVLVVRSKHVPILILIKCCNE